MGGDVARQVFDGRIDILINNAGKYLGGRLNDRQKSAIKHNVDLNVLAPLELTYDVLPDMLARKNGHVVHIGSIAGICPFPYSAVYAATKGAISAFNWSMQMELKGTGVRSSAVLPGLTKGDGGWARLQAAGHWAFRETTPTAIAKAVVNVLKRPRISVIVNPTPVVKATALLWDIAPHIGQAVYDLLGAKAFGEKLADLARTTDLDDPV